jgi:heat-inducible transcriptional repressor
MPLLDERLRRILTFVVESHVTRAEPVGSQYVRAAYHLDISPATIRNAMQQLEELGLLAHPHTSAGRVPTEAGYRYYVDELMRPETIPAPTRRAIDAALEEAHRGDAFDERLPAALARAARQLAVLSLHRGEPGRVHRFELVALEGGELLVAVGITAGPLATATWRPAGAVETTTLRRAESWVRAALPVVGAGGLEALAARAALEAPPEAVSVLAEALPRAARLVAGMAHPALVLDGAEHIASQPEFQSPDTLRPLVAVLTERDTLARALESFAGATHPRVSIGHEHAPAAIQSCSIVALSVPLPSGSAVVAVMGPVRMHYRRVVSLIAHLGERWGSVSSS